MWDYIQFIIISIIIIICLHHLYNYMIENYTRKDEKDVLSIQTQKYKTIIEDLSKQEDSNNHNKEQELLDFALNECQ